MKITKLFIAFLTLLIVTSCDCRQNISGKVIDSETGNPIENVSVIKENAQIGTETNGNGEFELKEISGGIFSCPPMNVIISKSGYNTQTLKIKNEDSVIIKLEKINTIGNQILGVWTICESLFVDENSNETITTKFNVCPKIEFNDSNIAILTLPSGENETYKWNIIADSLNIERTKSQKTKMFFNNQKYSLKINTQENDSELMLSAVKSEGYILRK